MAEGIAFFSMKVSVYSYANSTLNEDPTILRKYLNTLSLTSNFMEAFSFAVSSGLYSIGGYKVPYSTMIGLNILFMFLLFVGLKLFHNQDTGQYRLETPSSQCSEDEEER